MTDQHSKSNIIEEIKQKAPDFQAQLPPYAWSRIESRLDNKNTKREISFYKLFYNAAIVFLVLGVLIVMGLFINDRNSSRVINDYASSIQELSDSPNSYPVYDIHQLHKAYLKLQSGQPKG